MSLCSAAPCGPGRSTRSWLHLPAHLATFLPLPAVLVSSGCFDKVPQAGGLNSTHLLPPVPEAGSECRPGCWPAGLPARARFLAPRGAFSLRKQARSLGSLLRRTRIPSRGFRPHDLPKASFPNTLTLGIRVSIHEFGEDRRSASADACLMEWSAFLELARGPLFLLPVHICALFLAGGQLRPTSSGTSLPQAWPMAGEALVFHCLPFSRARAQDLSGIHI